MACSFRLPDNVEDDKIKAEFANGALTVTMPKAAASKSPKRSIAIDSK